MGQRRSNSRRFERLKPSRQPAHQAILQAEHESETVLDIVEELASYPAGEFHQEVAVDRDDLGHVRHRVFRQASDLGWQQHVARGIDETSVAAQHNGNDSVQRDSG